jgi:cytochrome c-type biogenesis protein CcmH/NrfF
VAQEQKRLVKTLVKKGWSKNEVIYEMQRVYGNDVLILKSKLHDERGAFAKFGLPLMMMTASGASLLLFRRGRRLPRPMPT